MAYERIPLALGTTVEGANGKYTIIDNNTNRTAVFKSGGSTLVYLVAFEGNTGSDITGTIFLLKEIYPRKEKPVGALARGDDGRTLVEVVEGSGGLATLEQHIKRTRKEVQISQNKARDDDLISHKFDAFYEKERYYVVDIYKSKAQTLDEFMAANKMFGHLKSALLIGKHLCEALSLFHSGDAAYLHLDIKPDNILTTTIAGADNFPKLRLIDFNSAHQLDINGQIEDLDSEEVRAGITSNRGFSPKEVIHKDTQGHLINKASDIYSVVAVMYWAIFNDYYGRKSGEVFSQNIISKDAANFMDFSNFFIESLNDFFIQFTDRRPDTLKRWSKYTTYELLVAINELLQQCDLELHNILINDLEKAKENAYKIHKIEGVKKTPPEYSDEYSKEKEYCRKKKLWPTGVIPKELYETLPLKWRALSQLRATSFVLLLMFFFYIFLSLRSQISENIPSIIGLLIGFWIYNAICSRLFGEWKNSVSYMDCLGYTLAKWTFLLFMTGVGLMLYILDIYLIYDFWGLLSVSSPLLYLASFFAILHIIIYSLFRWSQGVSNKILINNDYQREIDALISQSALSELEERIPKGYKDVFVIQKLIDIAKENELIKLDAVINAYNLTLH